MATQNNTKAKTVGVEEAGKMLGVGRTLAYKMAKEGTIPTIKLGSKRLVVPISKLEAMLGV